MCETVCSSVYFCEMYPLELEGVALENTLLLEEVASFAIWVTFQSIVVKYNRWWTYTTSKLQFKCIVPEEQRNNQNQGPTLMKESTSLTETIITIR